MEPSESSSSAEDWRRVLDEHRPRTLSLTAFFVRKRSKSWGTMPS